MKFVISRTDDNRKASEIIQKVDVLKTISWIKAAWEEVSDRTVTNCFRKCGFCIEAQHGIVQPLDQDEEFANVTKELAGNVDPDDYVDFDKQHFLDASSRCGQHFSAGRKFEKKLLKNMKTHLTRLWMYQAMKS